MHLQIVPMRRRHKTARHDWNTAIAERYLRTASLKPAKRQPDTVPGQPPHLARSHTGTDFIPQFAAYAAIAAVRK